jgi:serine/threonine protein kinase/Flp pilus assembly protein TadD
MAHAHRSAGAVPVADQDSDAESLRGILGDFRLLRKIGCGGMGVVYEAEQISLRRRVALKVLPLAATMDPRHLQRFKNEAQAAAGLHHTNIVPVYYVGSERGVHYYAMQYIEGRDLASVIAQLREPARGPKPDPQAVKTVAADDSPAGAPSAPAAADTSPVAGLSTEGSTRCREYFRTVARLGIQAAQALDHAHQQGVVHRDIKPANLLVDAAGRLWVTDFGLAQFQSDTRLTLTGDIVGTLRYMSPEQALAKRAIVDHRTDVYSLGATLNELLTLEPVFNGRDRQELLRQIAFDEPQPPRRLNRAVPAELETIVLKALEKNPADRYATAGELADDLRRYLEDKPIRARRPSWGQVAAKWARRHPAIVWAAVVVLAVTVPVLAASTWTVWQEKNQTEEALGQKTTALIQAQADRELAQRKEREANEQRERAEKLLRASLDLSQDTSFAAGQLRAAKSELAPLVAHSDAAMKVWEELVAAYPNDPNLQRGAYGGLFQLGKNLQRIGQYADAARAFQRATAIMEQMGVRFPNDKIVRGAYVGFMADSFRQWGLSLAAAGKFDEAERAYRQALAHYAKGAEKSPKDDVRQQNFWAEPQVDVHNHLGLLYLDGGRLPEAREAFRQALALVRDCLARNPNDEDDEFDLRVLRTQSNSGLGDVLHALELPQEAADCYRQVRNDFEALVGRLRGGFDAEVRVPFGWFLLTCPDPQFRDPRLAVQLAEADLAKAQTFGDMERYHIARTVLGAAQYRARNGKAALEALERADPPAPWDNRRLFFLCMAQWESDQKQAAQKQYTQAVQQMEKAQPKDAQLRRLREEAAALLGIKTTPPEKKGQ